MVKDTSFNLAINQHFSKDNSNKAPDLSYYDFMNRDPACGRTGGSAYWIFAFAGTWSATIL